MAGAGDGDVAKAGVEQVWVDASIGVNEDAFRREALGAVTGNGVPVIEMTMLVEIELLNSIWRLLSRRAEGPPYEWDRSMFATSPQTRGMQLLTNICLWASERRSFSPCRLNYL